VVFEWRSTGHGDIGLIAEDVAEISPLLVSFNENHQVEGIRYRQLTALLVRALQQQQQQIDALRSMLAMNNPEASRSSE
jgi:hypothetical protein